MPEVSSYQIDSLPTFCSQPPSVINLISHLKVPRTVFNQRNFRLAVFSLTLSSWQPLLIEEYSYRQRIPKLKPGTQSPKHHRKKCMKTLPNAKGITNPKSITNPKKCHRYYQFNHSSKTCFFFRYQLPCEFVICVFTYF